MSADSEARLTDLEIRYVHLERLTEELSSVIALQAKQLESLQSELRQVSDRLLGGIPNEPPPHY